MNKKRAAIYIRVSTSDQAENGMSLKFQEDELISFSDWHWYILDKEKHIYKDEWVSWAKEDREGLKSMMKAASRWEFDIVLVYKVDRFFRKILLLLQYVQYLDKYWVKFKTKDWDFSTDWPNWKLMLSIFWVMAEMERDLIRERTMNGKKKKASEWYYVWWWKAPLWYYFNKTTKWVKLKVNEDEKKLINKIFTLFSKEKKTLWEITKILEADWEKTRDDIIMENWWKTKKTTKKIWHSGVLSKIIRNEMYIWKYYYWKTEKITDPITREVKIHQNTKDKMVELSCEPILDDISLFEKAQELLISNKVKKNVKDRNHPFTWLLVCDHCKKFYVWYKTKKSTHSYRCNWKMKWKKTTWEARCINHEVSENYLVDNIWNKIYEIFKSPDNAIEKYYNEKKVNSELSKFQKELKKLNQQLDKHNWALKNAIKDKAYADNLEKEIYDEVISEAKMNIESTKVRIVEISNKISSLEEVEKAKNNLYRLKDLYKKKIDNLTEEKKIEIIKELVFRITIKTNWELVVLFKFENEDNDNNDSEWKRPVSWENNFLTEMENDANYSMVEKFQGVSNSTNLNFVNF